MICECMHTWNRREQKNKNKCVLYTQNQDFKLNSKKFKKKGQNKM